MKSGDALKAASRAYEKKVAKLQAQWVPGAEMTAEELAQVQPTLKAEFLEREERRAA